MVNIFYQTTETLFSKFSGIDISIHYLGKSALFTMRIQLVMSHESIFTLPLQDGDLIKTICI